MTEEHGTSTRSTDSRPQPRPPSMAAALIPIIVFVVLALTMLDAGYFSDNFWGGNGSASRISGQVM